MSNRAAGRFSIAWRMTASSGSSRPVSRLRRGAGTLICIVMMSKADSDWNGAWPASISNKTTPAAYRSARASMSGSARHCSGDMYAGVPIVMPVRVLTDACAAESFFARPKSRIFTSLAASDASGAQRKMLSGLMSRWTTPARCAAPTPDRTPTITVRACANVSGP